MKKEMKEVVLSDIDYKELKDICTIFITTYPHVVDMHSEYKFVDLPRSANDLVKFGTIIGFKGNAIYQMQKKRIIRPRNIALIEDRFKTGLKEFGGEKILKSYQKRFENFKSRISDNAAIANTYEDNALDELERFKGKKWYSYERFLETIGRKVIQFSDVIKNGQIGVTIVTAKEGMKPWKGFGYCDASSRILILNTSIGGEKNSLPTNYMFRMDNEVVDFDLCIGHVMLANSIHGNIVSKTVLIKRQDENAHLTALEIAIDNPEINNLIDPAIVRFLRNREKNRLTSPHSKIISSTGSLAAWHSHNDMSKREQWNEKIIGKYIICYSKISSKPNEIVYDKLSIDIDVEGDLVANYFHEVDKGKPQKWSGEVTYSFKTRAAFISLKGPAYLSKSLPVSFIYFILNIPSGERDFEVLTGTLSGIRDEYDGSIALLAVAVKTDDNQLDSDKISKLENFFIRFKNNCSILPPTIPVATFNDLDETGSRL